MPVDAAARPRSSYAWDGRLGLIVPPTNTVNEAEWARLLPEGVTAHSQRMRLHPHPGTPEGARELREDLVAAIDMLLPMRPDVIAYACTAGSMSTPSDALPREMTDRCGVPVITTADSIVAALHALDATRISIVTPYDDGRNAEEVGFLAAHGIETLAIAGLGLGRNGPADFPLIAQTTLDRVRALVAETWVAGSEALLLTCTDFPTLPLIDALEEELGVPVLSSNTATLWAALAHTDLAGGLTAGGRLLRGRPA